MSQKTRSTLMIDAVAQAAATGAATALNPLKKLDAIAGLAGFVLRLFRSKEQLLPLAGAPVSRRSIGRGAEASSQDPARIQPGSASRRGPARRAAPWLRSPSTAP